jgi:hypothetical protein
MSTFLIDKLHEKVLKVTPQRAVIHDTIVALNNNPTDTALESFVDKNLLKKFKTVRFMMGDEAGISHYHLDSADRDRIDGIKLKMSIIQ